jgi:mannose-6-phosphate isomerase-like protein (cupin superfamily)
MHKREPWLVDPLGHLIGVERVENFFSHRYERDPLVVTHNSPKRFEGLISLDDVDRIITSVDLREGQVDLADASSNGLSRSDYVDGAGFIDRGAIADFHRGGATIILQQAHQIESSLGRFCRGLEFVFSAHVQTNLYLTPPNAQGFKTHYDNHDVFVIQVSGEKAWRLYDKPIDTPYRGEAFHSGVHTPGELKQEFLLKAGDCAYVPRGLMHDAMTSGDAPSLHVTVGLITRTWADLMLEAVSEAALRTPELRRSLPSGYARTDFDRTAARAQLNHLGEIVAREIKLDPSLDLMADAFIRSRAAENRHAVRDASRPVLAHESFRAQQFTPHRLAEDGDTLVLIAPGGELKFKTEARAAVERALTGAPFTPADLPGAKTPEALTARLMAYGLVTRV